MDKKTKQAADLFNSGNVKGALKIASKFKLGLSKDEQATLQRGYEAFIRPQFYASLNKNPDAMIKDATELFRKKWGHL